MQRTEHLYDTSNRLSTQTWQLLNSNGQYNTYSETYTYDVGDDLLTYVDGNGFGDYAYTYDNLRRLESKYCGRYTQTFNYLNLSSSRTTTQIQRIDYTAGTSEAAFDDFSLAYEYDNLGNIKKVTGTNITGHDAQYTYDIQGQLTSETVNGVAYNYAYDTYGNIHSVSGGESHTYTYGNDQWLDLLTAYDTGKIAYEGQTYTASTNTVSGTPTSGNPISYFNGARWTFEWEKGRQLASATSGNATASYTYDLNGIRSSKTVTTADGTVTYNFLTQNGKVVRQEWNGNFMDFIYDNAGRPYAIVNGNATEQALYYYVLNQQGDVIRILGPNDTVAATYTYNAWGEVISSSGWMANQNPIRYRGYFQDNETGFYYLNSRYYDPQIGRFINADSTDYLGANNDFISLNLFAYCLNNPVNMTDDSGNLPTWAKKFIVGTAIIAAAAVLTVATAGTGTAIACFAVGALKGAVVGAAAGAASGAVTGAVGHRLTTGSWDGAGQAALEGAADGYMSGAISGFISGGMTSKACFVAGTAVLTAFGSVAIEKIQAGDLVWAWDEETGEVALKEVVETYVNESDELIHVFVNGEEIITTPTHPFYSPVKGWKDAAKLRTGDILVLVNGEYVVVEKVQHEILEAPVTVYNFQVEDFHTYYVTDAGVLVHNSCNHNREWNSERRRFWRSQSRTNVSGADYGSYVATSENIGRMKRGLAPIGWDGYSVQLHHWEGIANSFYNYSPVSRTLHQIIHSIR